MVREMDQVNTVSSVYCAVYFKYRSIQCTDEAFNEVVKVQMIIAFVEVQLPILSRLIPNEQKIVDEDIYAMLSIKPKLPKDIKLMNYLVE